MTLDGIQAFQFNQFKPHRHMFKPELEAKLKWNHEWNRTSVFVVKRDTEHTFGFIVVV